MLFSGANVAFAEESGGFVGFGIGGGGAQQHFKQVFEGISEKADYKSGSGGINYGFVAGYKHFFTPYFGLRYYTNADFYHNLSKSNHISGGKQKIDIMAISYGFNVDFLGNFISNETLDFGGFVGVGVGATTLIGKHIKDLKDDITNNGVEVGNSENVSTTGLDVALNFGLRTNIAAYHGVELAVRVPFMPVEYYRFRQANGNDINSTMTTTFGQTFSILARYTFSF